MMAEMRVFARLRLAVGRWPRRVSILNRVWIGNSIVIVLGAVGGTILTRQLALTGAIDLILLFSFFGILLSLAVNYWIIRTGLRPLHELSRTLEAMRRERVSIPADLIELQDPDIHRLVVAIDELLAQLEARTIQLTAISQRAINAAEEERVRIARGLHDETAQAISILVIQLERIEAQIPQGFPELNRRAAEARKLAILLLEDLRKIIWDLRPSMLDDLGLIPAIRWYARTHLEEAGIELDLGLDDESTRLPPRLETMLFRVTQEAVNNIIRHADASRAAIQLTQGMREVRLDVRDDGRGFDVERTAGEAVSRKQLGLMGIQERVSLAGGSMQVESAPGLGTHLLVHVPLLEEETVDLPHEAEMPAPTTMRQP
jgi:two-component system sensor histidine kinase UhpB